MHRVRRLRVFLVRLKIRRRKDIGGGEHRLPAKRPNSRFIEDGVGALGSFALGGSRFAPKGFWIGMVDRGDGPVQALAVLYGRLLQDGAIERDRFEEFNGGTNALTERLVGGVGEKN